MGIAAFPREAVKRDLSLMLRAGRKANIPVIIGSAGTAGGDVHVDWVLDIAREIVTEHHLTLRTAVIYAEQNKAFLKGLLRQNRILPLDPAPPISDSVIDSSSRIVGMMGVEPLQQAILQGPISCWPGGRVIQHSLPRFRLCKVLRRGWGGTPANPQSAER